MKKSLAMLGALVDPDKDCKLTKDEDNVQDQDRNPRARFTRFHRRSKQRLDKKKSLHNAPFTVADVEGDFVDRRQGDRRDRAGRRICPRIARATTFRSLSRVAGSFCTRTRTTSSAWNGPAASSLRPGSRFTGS